jgi:hypothetical protein
MNLCFLVIWTTDRRIRLETLTCTSADLGVAHEPVAISAFRRAAHPAAVTRTRGPGTGCAEPDIEQDILAHGHAFRRPRTAAVRPEPKVPTSVPDTTTAAAWRKARAAWQRCSPCCRNYARGTPGKSFPAIATTKPGRLTPPQPPASRPRRDATMRSACWLRARQHNRHPRQTCPDRNDHFPRARRVYATTWR